MMIQKKILIFITVCIGVLLSVFLWPEEKPRLPTAGSSIVVFGDSLAAGVGASEGGDIASRLAIALDTEVINLGVPGDTTADGLARINELLETDPRAVVILLGGNDAIKQLPIEQTFTNLSLIIERITNYGAAVVLVGEPGGLYGKQYEKEYEKLARKHQTFYVSNILSGLIGRTQYMSDYIHPNDTGYEKAAARILPEIEKALEDNN